MFIYENSIDEWVLLEDSNRKLFSYSPIKNIKPVSIDSDLERIYFMKKLSDSLKLNEISDEKAVKCHRLFQKTMFHNTDSGAHTEQMHEHECDTCNDAERKKMLNNDVLYLINIFNGYNRKNSHRDHIFLKPLDINFDMSTIDFYNSIFHYLDIHTVTYFKEVLKKYLEDDTDRIWDSLSQILDGFEGYTAYGILDYGNVNKLWEKGNGVNERRKEVKPVFAIYATFGERMCKFLEIDNDSKYFIHSHDLDFSNRRKQKINFDKYNPLLSPRFTTPKIDSYFIYSDIVKQTVRLGDSVSNLLSIITVDKSIVNIKNPINTFKTISHNSIYSIAIIVTDQLGQQLDFIDKQYSAVELFIKKRES